MNKEIKLLILGIFSLGVFFISRHFITSGNNFLGGCFLGVTSTGGVLAILDSINIFLKKQKKRKSK
ncbi:MAG: hypothetical protein ACRDDL_08720 [Sarcina sp.]